MTEADHVMAMMFSGIIGASLIGGGFATYFDNSDGPSEWARRTAFALWAAGSLFIGPPLLRLLVEVWLG